MILGEKVIFDHSLRRCSDGIAARTALESGRGLATGIRCQTRTRSRTPGCAMIARPTSDTGSRKDAMPSKMGDGPPQ